MWRSGLSGRPPGAAADNRTCSQSNNRTTNENINPGHPLYPQQALAMPPSFTPLSHMNATYAPSHHVPLRAVYPASAGRTNSMQFQHEHRPQENNMFRLQYSTPSAGLVMNTNCWQTPMQHNQYAVSLPHGTSAVYQYPPPPPVMHLPPTITPFQQPQAVLSQVACFQHRKRTSHHLKYNQSKYKK